MRDDGSFMESSEPSATRADKCCLKSIFDGARGAKTGRSKEVQKCVVAARQAVVVLGHRSKIQGGGGRCTADRMLLGRVYCLRLFVWNFCLAAGQKVGFLYPAT